MNRWFSHPGAPRLAATLAFVAALCVGHTALAQPQNPLAPKRPFPTHALRAHMVVVNAHEVTLNGTLTRLAPGSRIRSASNALVVSGGLVGQSFVVNYTRDSLGQAHEVWLLNEAEAADRRAGSEGMVITNIVSGTAAQ